ncbi:MAG: dienelactone hydrolase family protein [Afipia sp.]|jgi:dienelactone hydrolase|nr:dienelactone hydrolase family protein [Afipia sp.]
MRKLELLKAVPLALAVSLSYAAPAAAQAKLLQKLEQKLGLQPKVGAQGAEGSPNHRQEWLLPTADQITMSRAILFRPEGKGPFRLALIAHASPPTREARAKMSQPEYPALAATLVARGFAVIVPQRLGHGKTGGPYLEDPEGCDSGEYVLSAQATGEAIEAAMNFMRGQPFIRKDAAVIVGEDAGGWGALYLADQSAKNVSAIVVFAPGRGGRKDNRAGAVCAPDKLIAAVTDFGDGAKVPVTWFVAQNDSYFTPDFSKQMADAFAEEAGAVDFQIVPPYGDEGHALATTGDQALMEQLLANVKGLALQAPTSPVAPTQGVAAKGKQ